MSKILLEQRVERVLHGLKYRPLCQNLSRKEKLSTLLSITTVPNRYAKDVHVAKTVYGTDAIANFYCIGEAVPKGLIIQTLWQAVPGSADEKLPYLVMNLRLYPVPVAIIMHTSGMKEAAVDWFKSQVDGKQILGAFEEEKFVPWLSKHLNVKALAGSTKK
jgi:hypothetical protein